MQHIGTMVKYYYEKRFLIIIGAIMLAIGFIGAIPLVLLYKWGSSTRVRSHNSTPRAYLLWNNISIICGNDVYDYRCCWVFIISAWRRYASRRRIKAAAAKATKTTITTITILISFSFFILLTITIIPVQCNQGIIDKVLQTLPFFFYYSHYYNL